MIVTCKVFGSGSIHEPFVERKRTLDDVTLPYPSTRLARHTQRAAGEQRMRPPFTIRNAALFNSLFISHGSSY